MAKLTENEAALAILAIPTVFAGLIIMLIPFGLFNAWAVQKMYGWFLLPLGAPRLNVWQVWGITALITHMVVRTNEDKKIWESLAVSIFGTLFMLLLGFVLKSLI